MRYEEFLDAKTQLGGDHGFEPVWMLGALFPFQRDIPTTGRPSRTSRRRCRLLLLSRGISSGRLRNHPRVAR